MQVDPPHGGVGTLVTARVRGGPSGAFAGVFVAAIDGTPLGQFAGFSWLDSFGAWDFVDDVPPGLDGTQFLVRGYSVGFDGRLARSGDQLFVVD